MAGLAFILPSFAKAGTFVFGSGLAIAPFLYGGLVKEFGWLNEQEFMDAVAVAMITPGPVVITVGFAGYLTARLSGATVAAFATFTSRQQSEKCIYAVGRHGTIIFLDKETGSGEKEF